MAEAPFPWIFMVSLSVGRTDRSVAGLWVSSARRLYLASGAGAASAPRRGPRYGRDMDAASDPMVARCMGLEWRALFLLYSECLLDGAAGARIPAIALREKARRQELPVQTVGLVGLCLADTDDPQTVRNLAKAIAAFGSGGRDALGAILDKLTTLHVTDDDAFWTFDSLLHAVGFVAGPEAERAIDAVAALKPSPVVRGGGVYRGGLAEADRERMFRETLDRVRALLAQDGAVPWRDKRTEMDALPIKKPERMAPWRAR